MPEGLATGLFCGFRDLRRAPTFPEGCGFLVPDDHLAMHTRIVPAALFLLATANAQDFIQYSFDSTCTNEVINLATGTLALASNGTLETNSATSPYAAGVFGGSSLSGGASLSTYNRVRTGWDPSVQPITGDFTMAWFMKERTAPGTSLSYIMGAPSGGIRLFTNGVAGRGLYQRTILAGGGNGTNASITQDFFLPAANADIQTLAAAGWVHVAIVVDATAQTADWYVNGSSVLQLTGVPGAQLNLAGPFTVGYYTNASLYDLDEFLISLRAYTPAEILALSLAKKAGAGDYTSGIAAQCNPGNVTLDSTGGAPAIGNFNYGLTINVTQPSLYVLLFGFNRCSFAGGTFALPLDAGTLAPFAAGCWILTDIASQVVGIANPGQPALLPIPIPPVASYVGLDLYGQAVGVDLATSALAASNGVLTSIGN